MFFRGDSFIYTEVLFSTTPTQYNQYPVEYRFVNKAGKNKNHNNCGMKFRSELIIRLNDQICSVAGYPIKQDFTPATFTLLGTDYNNYGLCYMCGHDSTGISNICMLGRSFIVNYSAQNIVVYLTIYLNYSYLWHYETYKRGY